MSKISMAVCGNKTGGEERDSGRKKISQDVVDEKKKLEDMIAALFEKGVRNLGSNKKILRQSDKLDRLIVNKMLLDEIEEKYIGKKQTE